MCFGGDSQTVVQSQSIPSWLEGAAQGNIAKANQIAAQPWQQYTGPRLADWTPEMSQAGSALTSRAGDWQPTTNWATNNAIGAGNAAMGMSDFAAPQISANGWQDYYNPQMDAIYQQIAKQGAFQQNNINRKALQYGAFGGDSHALLTGRNNEGINTAVGQAAAGAFDTAMGRNLQAQGANQNAAFQSLQGRLAALQSALGAGQQAVGTTQAANNLKMGDINAIMSLGQAKRQDAQYLLDQARADFNEQRDWPLRGLNVQLSALGGARAPTTTTTTSPAPSSAAQGAGLGLAALGTFGQLGGVNGLSKLLGIG